MSKWIDCPICGSCDSRAEPEGEGYLVHCTNIACPSNDIEGKPFLVQLSETNEKLQAEVDAARNGQDAAFKYAYQKREEAIAVQNELELMWELAKAFLTEDEQAQIIDEVRHAQES